MMCIFIFVSSPYETKKKMLQSLKVVSGSKFYLNLWVNFNNTTLEI